jgi:hypothetical protein
MAKVGTGGGGGRALLVDLKAAIPSNMKGQDLSTPAVSYTLPKSTLSDHPREAKLRGCGVRHTLISSSVGAAMLLVLLLYIWFEGGSVGWLDGAVRDRPVVT